MSFIKILASIGIAQLAGIIGTIFTNDAIPGWYTTIAKPSWNPPNWIFGPVWVTLYTLMGIAAYLVWESPHSRARTHALTVYGIQLVLNALWSIIFFGWENPGLALIEIVLLWIAIVWTLILFYRIRPLAGYLLVPYLAWVSFASVLNFTIWQLN